MLISSLKNTWWELCTQNKNNRSSGKLWLNKSWRDRSCCMRTQVKCNQFIRLCLCYTKDHPGKTVPKIIQQYSRHTFCMVTCAVAGFISHYWQLFQESKPKCCWKKPLLKDISEENIFSFLALVFIHFSFVGVFSMCIGAFESNSAWMLLFWGFWYSP